MAEFAEQGMLFNGSRDDETSLIFRPRWELPAASRLRKDRFR
jgi:hypothetical protein